MLTAVATSWHQVVRRQWHNADSSDDQRALYPVPLVDFATKIIIRFTPLYKLLLIVRTLSGSR